MADDHWSAHKPQNPDIFSQEEMRGFPRDLLLGAIESEDSYAEKQREGWRMYEEHLKEGWKMYEELYQSQENILTSDMDHRMIAQAIYRFPKLDSIKMSVEGKICPPSVYLRNAHQAGLVRLSDRYGIYPFASPGVRQVLSVLLPFHMPEKTAHAKLRIFHAGYLSYWHLFVTHHTPISAIRRGLQNLTDLKLVFNIRRGEEVAQGVDIFEGEGHLRTTRNLQILWLPLHC